MCPRAVRASPSSMAAAAQVEPERVAPGAPEWVARVAAAAAVPELVVAAAAAVRAPVVRRAAVPAVRQGRRARQGPPVVAVPREQAVRAAEPAPAVVVLGLRVRVEPTPIRAAARNPA